MNEEEIKRESNKNLFITVIAILILILIVIGFSTAIFVFTDKDNNINSISTGNIKLDYQENVNGINITNAMPMTDTVGKKLTNKNQYFDFSVVADVSGEVNIVYEISAEKLEDSTLDNKDVKLYLEKKENGVYEEVMKPKVYTPLTEKTSSGTPVNSMLLYKGNIEKTTKEAFRLRMWVSDNANIDGISRTFKIQVNVNAKVDLKKEEK